MLITSLRLGLFSSLVQMLIKNLTSNAKKMMEMPNANATMENMGKLFQKNMAKHDVKSAISGVMVVSSE
jgi:hypothetical protein